MRSFAVGPTTMSGGVTAGALLAMAPGATETWAKVACLAVASLSIWAIFTTTCAPRGSMFATAPLIQEIRMRSNESDATLTFLDSLVVYSFLYINYCGVNLFVYKGKRKKRKKS